MKFDLIVKSGGVIDGTGNPWYRADVGVKDGKIAVISRRGLEGGEHLIEAKGSIFSRLHKPSWTHRKTPPRG